MGRTFIFDFDDTLADFSGYNTLVYKLPLRVLPPLGGLIKGVPQVLDFLGREGVELHLVTMNVVITEDQKWRKLDRVRIRKWFSRENIHMVREKTPQVFRNVFGDRAPDDCYIVGDSYTFDVKPGLEAGYKVLFIPRPLYKRRYPIPKDPVERLWVLKDIRDLLHLYPDL